MVLSLGTVLGPYEVIAALGAGGMGEVYRARDIRLDRTVAIKVLSSGLTASPDVKARFEREARAISQLNHPHICMLYDIGHLNGTDFLVMEYLDGETLAQRLFKGALPLDQALKIGIEISGALDRAHSAGIVHRDLKPGNIMLTKSGAKLLDFGLAKAAPLETASPTRAPLLSAAVTLSDPSPQLSPLTTQGAIIGTVQYMSPEQLQGKEADARSDIFAFGAVLYEMITGKRAFEGKSQLSVASAIPEKDPVPISIVQTGTPPLLDNLASTCLAKDPDQRFSAAHDVNLQLRWIVNSGLATSARPLSGERRNTVSRLTFLAFVMLALVAAGLGIWRWSTSRVTTGALALAFIPAPVDTQLNGFGFDNGPSAVAPDGSKIVFSAISKDGAISLWLRSIGSNDARQIPRTENASAPFWAPDSHAIGFVASSKLKTVNLANGNVETLCDVTPSSGGHTGTWSSSGTIVFKDAVAQPLKRISATGGGAAPLSFLKPGESYANPAFLPDGDHFLYQAGESPMRIDMASLSSGFITHVLDDAARPEFVNGQLLFIRGSRVFSQQFDPASGKVSDTPVPITSAGTYSAAASVLVFQNQPNEARLEWFTADGQPQGTIGSVEPYLAPRISPDGKQVLVLVDYADLWSIPASRGVSTRLTFEPGNKAWTVWSPDGNYVAYGVWGKDGSKLVRQASDGSGSAEVLYKLGSQYDFDPVIDWSPDGRYLSYDARNTRTGRFENWILPLFGDRKPFQIAPASASQFDGLFSPDGHWLAYFSYETGRPAVFVASFPGPGAKYQISSGGAGVVRWGTGNRLFYATTGDRLVEAELAIDRQSLQVKSIRPMFTLPILGVSDPQWDITRDGNRIIAVAPASPEANSIGLLLNWQAEPKK